MRSRMAPMRLKFSVIPMMRTFFWLTRPYLAARPTWRHAPHLGAGVAGPLHHLDVREVDVLALVHLEPHLAARDDVGHLLDAEAAAPELQHLVRHVAVEPLGDGHHRDHGGDPDEDAEHGEERAQLVRPEARRNARAMASEKGMGLGLNLFARRSSILPSRMWMVRWACSAMSRSWVTRMMVLPSLCSFSKSRMISSPVAVSRLPGGLVGEEDRGLHHQGAGDGHALALAARELVGLVVDARRRGRPSRGPAGPAPAARTFGIPA